MSVERGSFNYAEVRRGFTRFITSVDDAPKILTEKIKITGADVTITKRHGGFRIEANHPRHSYQLSENALIIGIGLE